MTRYEPKILTFTPDKKFSYQDMEDTIASYTLDGWQIVSMTHLQGMQAFYTVLLQREIGEDQTPAMEEKRA
ncbi:hypothetical protein [Ascidiaceihabitans sp.]|uniref:hypothetical protein n=1 Tax=Ascidiaceihabitans sp. TaxID=1872644 RepID=UPI0032969632